MLKTNKKVTGVILIIIGGYLLIGNTLLSLLLNYAGPIGWDVPISPIDYWLNWWNNYGLVTVIIGVFGLLVIILGVLVLIRANKSMLIITESN